MKTKIKQALATILILIFVLCTLSACDSKNNNESQNNSQESTTEHTSKKIQGEITGASDFSDDLAFVVLENNNEKVYCIDKDKNIVFELDIKLPSTDWIAEKFVNGYAIIGEGICNTKGEITYPEDIGVTKFFDYAFGGGYIIATKITADYSSSKKEMGILNTDFEWVIKPSEQLFNEFEEDLYYRVSNSESFYCNGLIYFSDSKKFLNLSTSEVTETANIELTSNTWYQGEYDKQFTWYDRNGELKVDFSSFDNIECFESTYKNGKIVVKFYNREVGKLYWSIANEKGTLLFNPIEESVDNYSVRGCRIDFDGENIILYNSDSKIMESYNLEGKKLAELNTETIDFSNFTLSDGIIRISSGKGFSFYTPEFNLLF